MSDATTDTAAAPPSAIPYSRYLKAWGALLVLTLIMVKIESPTIVMMGIFAKISIIMAVFMHLKDETFDFMLVIVFSIVFFAALLFGLIAPDGMAM